MTRSDGDVGLLQNGLASLLDVSTASSHKRTGETAELVRNGMDEMKRTRPEEEGAAGGWVDGYDGLAGDSTAGREAEAPMASLCRWAGAIELSVGGG
jgi:hypothetical protein